MLAVCPGLLTAGQALSKFTNILLLILHYLLFTAVIMLSFYAAITLLYKRVAKKMRKKDRGTA